MSVVHEHCSYVIMELQIQSLAYLFWDKKQIYFRIAIFFNIIETMLMAVGSIGDVLRGPAAPGQPYERFKCIIASFDISNSRHFLNEIIKN